MQPLGFWRFCPIQEKDEEMSDMIVWGCATVTVYLEGRVSPSSLWPQHGCSEKPSVLTPAAAQARQSGVWERRNLQLLTFGMKGTQHARTGGGELHFLLALEPVGDVFCLFYWVQCLSLSKVGVPLSPPSLLAPLHSSLPLVILQEARYLCGFLL